MLNTLKNIVKNLIYLLKKTQCKTGECCFISHFASVKGAVLEGANKIGINTNITNSRIGYATYIGNDCMLMNCTIGRYCSIAPRVSIIQGTHPTSGWVSTHPSFFSTLGQSGVVYVNKDIFEEILFSDRSKCEYVYIGNDVWIGYGVYIKAGVKIGDGAIIAAGSVIVNDIPSYAIVGGVPAKLIKYRFNKDDIEWLESFKWWEKDKVWIRNHSMYFNNIKILRNIIYKGKDEY